MAQKYDAAGSTVSEFLSALRQDLKYGLRMLWKNPGFSVAAILTLVVVQIALCVVQLIGAALMIRSFQLLQRVDVGFDPGNVLNVSLPTVKYPNADQQIAFFDELLRRVNAVPGVTNASISAALPLTPRRITPILPEGQAEVPLAQRPFGIVEAIGTDWFRTMRVPSSWAVPSPITTMSRPARDHRE
jgi:hypothetical protein